jgi:hypothetical protein
VEHDSQFLVLNATGVRFGVLSVIYMGMGQNLVPLVNIKIAGKWMFIPLKMVLIGNEP